MSRRRALVLALIVAWCAGFALLERGVDLDG
jgi:hypothetical protein